MSVCVGERSAADISLCSEIVIEKLMPQYRLESAERLKGAIQPVAGLLGFGEEALQLRWGSTAQQGSYVVLQDWQFAVPGSD